MSAITIDGDLIHYEKLGRGRPVILLHGWLGSWRYWVPTMQQLHLKYSVYTLDFVGFGDSAKNKEKYDVPHQTKVLKQFMDSLGIPKAAIIAHGLGAMVATRFTLENPDRVARLLMISLPLFDTGDLKDRVPAGTRVLLTGTRDRFSLAPNRAEIEAKEQTLMRSQLTDATVASRPPVVESPIPPSPTVEKSDKLPALGDEDDQTTRPTTPPPPPMSAATIHNPNAEMRQRLIDAAAKSAVFAALVNDTNQLKEAFTGKTLMGLLEKCFKKTDTIFEKLRTDIEKTDDKVLLDSAKEYSASRFLDDLRKITAPMLVVHGNDDPIIPQPSEDVWQYLTVDKDDVFVPIPLSGVRHFPMLESETFQRLAGDFLEIAEINKIEVRERWRRRSR